MPGCVSGCDDGWMVMIRGGEGTGSGADDGLSV